MKTVNKKVDYNLYDYQFFTQMCEGYSEFKEGNLSSLKRKQLEMFNLDSNISIVDIGFGRGEFLWHCHKKGARVSGVDISKAAYDIASKLFLEEKNCQLYIAQCTNLPFEDNSFDYAMSTDVIEHVSFEDGIKMLQEMHRVIKPGGYFIVHTSPNTLFTKFVYPLIKILLKLIDKDTVARIDNNMNMMSRVHVNEYNTVTLKSVSKKAGLKKFEIWIDKDIMRSSENIYTKNIQKCLVVKLATYLSNIRLFRCFFGNDLYLKSYKA